jgi:cysteine-rich repeat protein
MKARVSIAASILFGSLVLVSAACKEELITGVCESVADCPGVDTPCRSRVCKESACGYADEADGKAVEAQIDGDCKSVVCDGKGGSRVAALAEGSACAEAGGKVCNAAGICLSCVVDADCAGEACQDGACVPASCMDGVKNGSEPDVDCGGALCARCDDGKACAIGKDCKNSVCMAGACQPIACGDGARQGAEECDDGNMQSGDGCKPDCTADILFMDDMETGALGWKHELLNGAEYSISDQWAVSEARAASGTHSYYSGISASGAGDTRLTSPVFDLSSLAPGAKVRLTFSHFYHFDDCGDFDFDSDGALIEVLSGTTPFSLVEQVSPVNGYGDTLDDTCGNPIALRPAFTHDTNGEFLPVEVDLSPYVGRAIRLGFHVGWDCGNCVLEEGWYVDDVRVERLP